MRILLNDSGNRESFELAEQLKSEGHTVVCRWHDGNGYGEWNFYEGYNDREPWFTCRAFIVFNKEFYDNNLFGVRTSWGVTTPIKYVLIP